MWQFENDTDGGNNDKSTHSPIVFNSSSMCRSVSFKILVVEGKSNGRSSLVMVTKPKAPQLINMIGGPLRSIHKLHTRYSEPDNSNQATIS